MLCEEQIEVIPDVVYCTTDSGLELKLDIYRPKPEWRPTPLPVVIFLHGGGWETGDKGSKLGVGSSKYLAKYGFCSVSVNYRLTGVAPFPAQIHDAKAAVRWVRSMAERYGLNSDRIGVWGHSAGGHLVALLGASSNVPALEGDGGCAAYSSQVQAVVTSVAPIDLLQMGGWHNHPDSSESRLVGGPLLDNRAVAESANPLSYITGTLSTPYLILHGTEDEIVPYAQAELLYEAVPQATLIRIKGGDHDYTGGNLFWGEIYGIVLAFFHRHIVQSPELEEEIQRRREYMAQQVKRFSRE